MSSATTCGSMWRRWMEAKNRVAQAPSPVTQRPTAVKFKTREWRGGPSAHDQQLDRPQRVDRIGGGGAGCG